LRAFRFSTICLLPYTILRRADFLEKIKKLWLQTNAPLGKANTSKTLNILAIGAKTLTNTDNQDLEGLTLTVYLHAVNKGKPVGPRDVMKGAGLSSPSVAYRHLQKLEELGYLQKNEYGEYTLKSKAHIRGHVWLGRRLLPKMWLYASVFLAILVVEVTILVIHYAIETYEFKVFFLLLTLITGLALAVFALEGLLQSKRKTSALTE
jgi:hypothetical protein